jgi:hypothetical protein
MVVFLIPADGVNIDWPVQSSNMSSECGWLRGEVGGGGALPIQYLQDKMNVGDPPNITHARRQPSIWGCYIFIVKHPQTFVQLISPPW